MGQCGHESVTHKKVQLPLLLFSYDYLCNTVMYCRTVYVKLKVKGKIISKRDLSQ